MTRNSNPQVGIEILDQMTAGAAEWRSISDRYEALRLACVETLNPGLGHLVEEQVLHNIHNPSRPETESLTSKIKVDAHRSLVEEMVAARTLEELEAIRNGGAIMTLAKRITVIPHANTVRVIEFPNKRNAPISEGLIKQNQARILRVPEGRIYKGTTQEVHTLPMLGGAILLSLGQRNTLLFGLVDEDLDPQVTIDVRTVKN